MFNLENINIEQQFASEKEAINYIRSYIFQLYNELDYRVRDIQSSIDSLKNNAERKTEQ